MKKLYYFSKSTLEYKELRHYKIKILTLLSIGTLCATALIFTIYSFALSWFGGGSFTSLKEENKLLKEKLNRVIANYDTLNKEVDELLKINNDLRLAANLEPISDDEQLMGVGGGYFDNTLDFLSGDANQRLQHALNYMDNITTKINFEKKQYLEISGKLKENKKLFESIPAIKPCNGNFTTHSFGMRVHPILNIRRMHDGIDIITDKGTPVHATGNGKVDFVGNRGGLGLAVEIDHGFGYKTIYGHLSKINVKVGQKIARGDVIGNSGSTGLSSGPHLHYEVEHNGIKQNPAEFFFDDLNFFEGTNEKK